MMMEVEPALVAIAFSFFVAVLRWTLQKRSYKMLALHRQYNKMIVTPKISVVVNPAGEWGLRFEWDPSTQLAGAVAYERELRIYDAGSVDLNGEAIPHCEWIALGQIGFDSTWEGTVSTTGYWITSKYPEMVKVRVRAVSASGSRGPWIETDFLELPCHQEEIGAAYSATYKISAGEIDASQIIASQIDAGLLAAPSMSGGVVPLSGGVVLKGMTFADGQIEMTLGKGIALGSGLIELDLSSPLVQEAILKEALKLKTEAIDASKEKKPTPAGVRKISVLE